MRAEAERQVGDEYADKVFPERLYEVRRESAKIQGDLASDRRVVFDQAVEALCKLSANEVAKVGKHDDNSANYIGRTRVTEAIDAIVKSLN